MAVLHDVSEQVWNNAQFMMDKGTPEDKVIKYVMSRPHSQTPQQVEKLVTSRQKDTVARIYAYSYEAAMLVVRNTLKLPNEQQMDKWASVAALPNSLGGLAKQ
jgi:hypothetical protein